MGKYVSKADLENVFGKDNIATWSNLDGEAGADEARIATAIAVAEEDIENRFRDGRYAIPFSPIPLVVKDWCARLAGIWLFENRPGFNKSDEEKEGFEDVRDIIDREIEAYTSGQRRLACTLVDSGNKQVGGPVVV